MCGIAGFRSFSHAADPAVLKAMVLALSHRGPDEFSGFCSGGTALGHARLSIVDIDGGHQPSVSSDRTIAVVFNGEIFNYLELREGLKKLGYSFRTQSEVETLRRLYCHYGEACFAMLEGQFAIALWDAQNDKLFLVRDRFGIRPLFWHHGEGTIAFASEVKALALRPEVTLRLNRRALVQTFRFWTVCGDTTAFENIQQVPSAHYMRVHGNEMSLHRYWEWPLPDTNEPLGLGSDDAYFSRFREELDMAVQRQRMADVPVASYLSGGIDSSVIAGLLSRQIESGGQLRTYSVAFEDPEYDESNAQRIMAEHLGVAHTTVRIGTTDIGQYFPQVVWQAETPLFRTAPVPLFLLSKQVRSDGVKVVMTGEGADEVLLGYDLFREASILRFWSRKPESKWRGQLFRRLYQYLPQFRNPRFINLVIQGYQPFLHPADERFYAMNQRWNNGKALEVYFSTEMQSFARQYDPVDDLLPWLPSDYVDADDLSRAQAVECLTLLSGYLLSSQGDRMSMSHAVEGRYPYLDDRFVRFANTLPRRLKLRGLRDKFVLRNAFRNMIPSEIYSRPKTAYQAPDLKGFFEGTKLKDYVEELFSPRRIIETGLFDPERVEALVRKGSNFNLARVGVRDNMAFTLMLSTMLLDEIFVKRRWSMSSDIESTPNFQWV